MYLNRRTALRLLIGLPVLGGARAVRAAAGEGLEAAFGRLAARLGPHALVAVRVLDAETGAVLLERHPDLSLNPASNMKLLTSAAALARLGTDFRYETRLSCRGGLTGGTALSLQLIGGGDPVLRTEDLRTLVRAAKERGLRRVEGPLQVDDFRYDAVRLGVGWNWDDETYYYSAQVSALGLDGNVVRTRVTPGPAPGDPARVAVGGPAGLLTAESTATTGEAGGRADLAFTRERGRNHLLVSGVIPAGSAEVGEWITVEDPAIVAGKTLAGVLAEEGVGLVGSVERRAVPAHAEVLARHPSPPLAEVCSRLNKPSDNLIAEMMLKELGWQTRGRGSAGAGGDFIEAWLREAGIGAAGVRVNDGSGLSRQDLVTTRVLSGLLMHAQRQEWGPAFLASLPLAGQDGTLRRRMTEGPARGKIRAKTGSLSQVSALSGYAEAEDGRRLVFALLINNYPGRLSDCKSAEDAFAEALVTSRLP